MKINPKILVVTGLISVMVLLSSVNLARVQDEPVKNKSFLSEEPDNKLAAPHIPPVQRCKGPITSVFDVGLEGVRTTSFNWSSTSGGGESGRFDPTPLLSTSVTLTDGCLNAHLSGIVGSRQTYGPAFSRIAMFQVTLTPPGGTPQHMFGHFENPYGFYGPAVALEAERDVDMYASNFFQPIGNGPGQLPPGTYRVDVWWSGGPVGGGGAIGADFILKLYQR